MARPKTARQSGNGATVGFEAQLWAAADKLRGVMDAAEYKHVVLGLIFLKYISDSFAERYSELERETADPKSEWYVKDEAQRRETLEDRDSYTMARVYFVPPEARWSYLQSRAKNPKIGLLIDNAMTALERDNPKLKGVLPKNYAREQIDKATLGGLIDLFANVGLGDKENRSKDLLGRAYEYFLTQFASAEGKKGGQFYTPRCVVRLLVAMLEPFKGRVFDPCCGSGGMFVQSERFVLEHGGNLGDISVFGQERNQTTYRLCVMNLAIRGIEGSILWNNEGSFHVQSRSFAEMLDRVIKEYHNRTIETLEVIERLIKLAQEMRKASERGEKLKLSEEELAFYDALETNDSAVAVLGDEVLRAIAREVADSIRKTVTIDWTMKESVKAKLRVLVKRVLRKYNYPPDKQPQAVETVLQQVELIAQHWAA